MSLAISIRRLGVTFRGGFRGEPVHALKPFDLEIECGTVLGVLGPNGSGKTTLLRVLAGLQRQSTGAALVLGRAPSDPSLLRRVGYQPEGPLPLGQLDALSFLEVCAAMLRMRWSDSRLAAQRLLREFGLDGDSKKRIRAFSTGMQKRLALAAVLLSEPELLLLDEPTAGLDPMGSEMVIEKLGGMAANGATVLLASHDLQEVERICSRVVVLESGHLRAEGTLDELLGREERRFVVRGLDDEAASRLPALVASLGGEVVECGREREHLYAFYRRLAKGRPT
ncbi:MAG: ABC transporter ATP-binding protein [Planctomycetota bacterium]